MQIEVTEVEYREVGMGLFQWSNGDIAISGGMRQAGYYGRDKYRLKFAIYGIPEYRAAGHVEADFGTIDLIVRYGDKENDEPVVEALIDIAIRKDKRRQGYGERAVAVAASACPDDLKVYDIKKSAVGFWRKLGVEIEQKTRQIDGILIREPSLAPTP